MMKVGHLRDARCVFESGISGKVMPFCFAGCFSTMNDIVDRSQDFL